MSLFQPFFDFFWINTYYIVLCAKHSVEIFFVFHILNFTTMLLGVSFSSPIWYSENWNLFLSFFILLWRNDLHYLFTCVLLTIFFSGVSIAWILVFHNYFLVFCLLFPSARLSQSSLLASSFLGYVHSIILSVMIFLVQLFFILNISAYFCFRLHSNIIRSLNS